jgi:hypothetical protein
MSSLQPAKWRLDWTESSSGKWMGLDLRALKPQKGKSLTYESWDDKKETTSEGQLIIAAHKIVHEDHEGAPLNWDEALWGQICAKGRSDRLLLAAMFLVWEASRLDYYQSHAESLVDKDLYEPCDGCGASRPSQVCIGCRHDFTKVAATA